MNLIQNTCPLPLMAGSFEPGQSQQYMDALMDEEMRRIALCERYYYCGQGEKCVQLAQSLIASDRFSVKISAVLMFGFGNICAGNPKDAKSLWMHFKRVIEEQILLNIRISEQEKSYVVFIKNLSTVLLHLDDNPLLEMDLKPLPGGVRLFACYVLAHDYYLRGEYGRSIGVCETALSLCDKPYPIGEIYMHLMLAVDYMNLHNVDKADAHFLKAWQIAEPDGFIEPFAEHHGLLHGMIEIHLRKAAPERYEQIIQQVYVFADAWRQVHNPQTGERIAGNLTTTEFTVAMLASKGWRNERIAKHMDITVNTVRTHLASIYQKLNIKNRNDLSQFMLK